jgi:glycosyltransferase 2 family protein
LTRGRRTHAIKYRLFDANTGSWGVGLGTFFNSQIVRWGVTLALVAYALGQLKSEEIRQLANWNGFALLFAASAVLVVVVGLNAVRWVVIARTCELRLPWGRSLQWTMIGHFFNQIFPSSIGGDVVRGVLAGRGSGDIGGTVTSIALDRLAGFVALLALIAVGQPLLLARLNDASLSRLALAVVLVGLGAVIAPFVLARVFGRHLPGRLQEAVRRFSDDAYRLIASPLLACTALLIALVMHGSNLVLTAAIANQLGATVSLLDVLLVVPTVVLIASLPISIGGWGVREAALAVGFTALGQPASVAVATSLVIGMANLISGLPGAGTWGLLSPAERHTGSLEKPAKTA